MPEIHFRLVAVSSDGREITFPSAEVQALGTFKDCLFLRLKKDTELTQDQMIGIIKEMRNQSGIQHVVFMPWYIDLIKLVPVR